jgi:hypothetical protein
MKHFLSMAVFDRYDSCTIARRANSRRCTEGRSLVAREKNDPANKPVLTGMVAETGPESVAGLERKTQPRPS